MNYINNPPYQPIPKPSFNPEFHFQSQMTPSGNTAIRNNQTITVVIRK